MNVYKNRAANIIAWSAFTYLLIISAYLALQAEEKYDKEMLILCSSAHSLSQTSYSFEKTVSSKCRSFIGSPLSDTDVARRFLYSKVYEAVSLQEWLSNSLSRWALTKWHFIAPYFLMISIGYFFEGQVRIVPWNSGALRRTIREIRQVLRNLKHGA